MTASDRVIVGVLLLVMMTAGTDHLVMTPILPSAAQDLNVGPDIAGLWISVYALGTAFFALTFGPISDRFGRQAVLRLGITVLTLGTFLCGWATSSNAMLMARFTAGAGAGMLVTSTTSFAGDHFSHEHRAVVVSWIMGGFFLSLIIAVPIGALLADAFGWRVMFLVIAGFASVVAALLFFILPTPQYEQRSKQLSVGKAAQTYRRLLITPPVMGILLMSMSIGLSMTMFSVYSSPWMAATFGLNTAERGMVYAVGGPAVLIGGPLAGRLSNQWGRVHLVIAGSTLMGLMQLLMPLTMFINDQLLGTDKFQSYSSIGNTPWPLMTPAIAVFFLTMAAGATRSGPFQTLALEVSPVDERGAVSALRNGFNQLGSGLGAALGAFLWSYFDSGYLAICIVAACITFLGAFLLRSLVGSDCPMPPVTTTASR